MSQPVRESKLRLAILAAAVCTIVVLGSIGLVRFSNRNRVPTPAMVIAAQNLAQIPDSAFAAQFPAEDFTRRRGEFAEDLAAGRLPVDSARAFYKSYAQWMRDGDWDSSDVRELAGYLGVTGE